MSRKHDRPAEVIGNHRESELLNWDPMGAIIRCRLFGCQDFVAGTNRAVLKRRQECSI